MIGSRDIRFWKNEHIVIERDVIEDDDTYNEIIYNQSAVGLLVGIE